MFSWIEHLDCILNHIPQMSFSFSYFFTGMHGIPIVLLRILFFWDVMSRQLLIGTYYPLTRRHIQEEQILCCAAAKISKLAQYSRFSISPALVDFLVRSIVLGLFSVYWISDRICQVLGYFKFIILVGNVKLRRVRETMFYIECNVIVFRCHRQTCSCQSTFITVF
jgi:hypothetical protein